MNPPMRDRVRLGVAIGTTVLALSATGVRAQTISDLPAATAIQEGDVDCGTDLGCFADQAPDCTPSGVEYTTTLDFAPLMGLPSGVLSSTTDALRMQPDPNGSDACQFSLLVRRVDNRLLPEALQALKDQGATQVSIDSTQKRMADSGRVVEGRSGTCLFAPAELSTLLGRWLAGSFSSADFETGTCHGSYFGG